MIFVAGLINIETTLRVEGFPVEYAPVRYPFFAVRTTVSGVGYNVALALAALGEQVHFASLIGHDYGGESVRAALAAAGVADKLVATTLEQTAQSVILFEPGGQRAIFTDLKDIQEQPYPQELYEQGIAGCKLAVLCNINFARPLLELTRRRGIPIATDVHAIADLDDTYNRDYMAAATLLFQSHERLPCSPEQWAQQLIERYHTPVVVIGLGGEGALLAVRDDGFLGRVPAVQLRPVVNTIGAGDALFSAFVYHYAHNNDPYEALRRAVLFAGYKVGGTGGADSLLNAADLEALWQECGAQINFS